MPADLKGLAEVLAKSLAEKPEEVVVEEQGDGDTVYLDLEVAEGDVGRMIGRGGRTARSLRTILSAAAAKEEKRCSLDILD